MEAKRPGKQLGSGHPTSLSTEYIPCGGVMTQRSPMIKTNNLMSGHEDAHWLALADCIISCKWAFGNEWLYPMGSRNESKGIWQTASAHSSCMSYIPIIYWRREPSLDLSWLCFSFLIFGGTAGGCCTLTQFPFRVAVRQSGNVLHLYWYTSKHDIHISSLYTQQKKHICSTNNCAPALSNERKLIFI